MVEPSPPSRISYKKIFELENKLYWCHASYNQESEVLILEIINTHSGVKYRGVNSHCALETYAAVVEKDVRILDVAINNSKKVKFGPIANILCEEEQVDNENNVIIRPNNIITYLNWRLEQAGKCTCIPYISSNIPSHISTILIEYRILAADAAKPLIRLTHPPLNKSIAILSPRTLRFTNREVCRGNITTVNGRIVFKENGHYIIGCNIMITLTNVSSEAKASIVLERRQQRQYFQPAAAALFSNIIQTHFVNLSGLISVEKDDEFVVILEHCYESDDETCPRAFYAYKI